MLQKNQDDDPGCASCLETTPPRTSLYQIDNNNKPRSRTRVTPPTVDQCCQSERGPESVTGETCLYWSKMLAKKPDSVALEFGSSGNTFETNTPPCFVSELLFMLVIGHAHRSIME